jgi:ferritin
MAGGRVIELATLYPGPLAGRLLTGWGFEVVKVEPPGGDPNPFYNIYRCADGKVALGAVEPKFWERFCVMIGRPDLISRMLDPGAVAEVENETSRIKCGELLNRAAELDVPLAPVLSLEEVAKRVDLDKLISAFLKSKL